MTRYHLVIHERRKVYIAVRDLQSRATMDEKWLGSQDSDRLESTNTS